MTRHPDEAASGEIQFSRRNVGLVRSKFARLGVLLQPAMPNMFTHRHLLRSGLVEAAS